MRLDFWNNPLVVTAFRLKYRRGSPTTWTSLYLFALVTVGAILYRFQDPMPIPWTRVYLLVILGVQILLSGAIAAISTGASLRNEVVNRTLDFQRIATLGPRQILVGKLLGEPAAGYLLTLASFPLALLCALGGATSVGVLVLLYVQVATTNLLLGALGLVQKLEPPAERSGSQQNSGNAGAGIGIVVLFCLPGLIFNLRSVMSNPWTEFLVGAFTPLLALYEVGEAAPGQHQMALWGIHVPYLFVTPLFQIAAALGLFEIMVRKLTNPLDPAWSKPMAYAVLAGVDVLAGGLLWQTSGQGLSPTAQCVVFSVVHLLASLMATAMIAPRREMLLSWMWRFRGRMPRWLDSLWGQRAEVSMALVAFSAIGAVAMALLVWLPAWGSHAAGANWAMVAEGGGAYGVACVILLVLGLGDQWTTLAAGKHGRALSFLMAFTLVIVPIFIGGTYDEILPQWTGRDYEAQARLAYAFSPLAQFVVWFSQPADPLPSWPLPAVYIPLLVFFWLGLRRTLRAVEASIDAKLSRMGVLPGKREPRPSQDAAPASG